MEIIAVTTTLAVIHVVITYTGIYQFHLNYLQMLGLLVTVTFVGSFLTRSILPPTAVFKQGASLLKGTTLEEIAVTEVISLAALVAVAYMLWTRFGGPRWFGIFIASNIASAVAYYFL